MACYQSCGNPNRGSFTPLKNDKMEEKYLKQLRDFAQEVKPVFRYNCPAGYNDNATELPDDIKQIAPNSLWFIDHHGHACKPDAGWGTQPSLNAYDQVAEKYRQSKGIPDSKVSSVVNEMLCSPCARSRGVSKRSVSQASDIIMSTISDIRGTDSVLEKGDKSLGGGASDMLMSTISDIHGTGSVLDSKSTLGGGAFDDALSAISGVSSLSGGAKLSEDLKCQIQSAVAGLSADEADQAEKKALQVIETFREKEVKSAGDRLECILSNDKYSTIKDDVLSTKDENGKENFSTPQEFAQEAAVCAEVSIHPSLKSSFGYNDDMINASCAFSNSCSSLSMKRLQQLKNVTKTLEPGERLYKKLMKIYSKCRAKSKACCGAWCEEDELKYKKKMESAYRRFSSVAEPYVNAGVDVNDLDEMRKTIDEQWAQMKACAQLCGSEVDCKATPGCVRSDVCGSNVCVPEFLATMKARRKRGRAAKCAVEDLSEWFSDFYADQRKLEV